MKGKKKEKDNKDEREERNAKIKNGEERHKVEEKES